MLFACPTGLGTSEAQYLPGVCTCPRPLSSGLNMAVANAPSSRARAVIEDFACRAGVAMPLCLFAKLTPLKCPKSRLLPLALRVPQQWAFQWLNIGPNNIAQSLAHSGAISEAPGHLRVLFACTRSLAHTTTLSHAHARLMQRDLGRLPLSLGVRGDVKLCCLPARLDWALRRHNICRVSALAQGLNCRPWVTVITPVVCRSLARACVGRA